MTDIAIRVEHLSKLYRIGARQERHDTLRDALVGARPRIARIPQEARDNSRNSSSSLQESTDLWALRDVSFEVRRGEVVGIIGRNGAGKSTLLKILSRITEPTEGRAEIHGRVGSLLEVGTGFHPELTGRENIYLNGAILGMRRAEIARRLDEIVAFSDIEKFLDTPVKRYSSGMYVRLAFAVAAHLEPEILLVDEVLAVGDAQFQKKCLGKMEDVARQGRTVLFVSHNMAAVEHLCEQAILVEGGHVVAAGPAPSMITQYLTLFDTGLSSRDLADPAIERTGSGEARFVSVSILSLSGESISCAPMGQGIRVRLEVLGVSQVNGLELGVGLFSAIGIRFCGFNSHVLSGLTFDLQARESVQVDCVIPRMNISPGTYRLSIRIVKRDRVVADLVEQAVSFDVVPADVFGTGRIPAGRNLIFMDASWERVDLRKVVEVTSDRDESQGSDYT